MQIPFTLSKYLGKNFLYSFITIFASVTLIIILFDSLELIRRSYSKNIPLPVILEMTLLKVPSIIQKIIPFAVLIAGMINFTKMTKTSELVVARAVGISVWQFLMPAIFIAFMIGVALMTIFNPVASVMLSKYEHIEAKYFKDSTSTIVISASGLWLRQMNEDMSGKIIIHSKRTLYKDMHLYDVKMLVYAANNKFVKRIDAKESVLKQGYWDLKDVSITEVGRRAVRLSSFTVPTNLSKEYIQESFAPPETMSFWVLPEFIKSLQDSGFSAIKHILYWHSILATPLFLASMVFLAATFSLRSPRKGGVGFLVTGGIVGGVIVYFMTDIVFAMGLAGNLPVLLSAWSPSIICILLGLYLMLHLEDG